MYEAFYGFREKPFSLLPDPGFLYPSKKHRMALTLLEYGLLNQAGFTVISGDIGTGKTTLVRQLLQRIEDDIRVGLISNTHQGLGELMQWIALAFDLPHEGRGKVELYRAFVDFVIDQYAAGRRTVLIVDEAQNMSAATLEELRMLSNINADQHQVLQIVLVGQRELRDTLRRPDLVQFAQRIGVDYHLEPLEEDETPEYIRFRCEHAGGDRELFSEAACHVIHRASGGVPRLINQLCDTALIYGYGEQCKNIDAELARAAIEDRTRGGLFPGAGRGAPGTVPMPAPAPAPEDRTPRVTPPVLDTPLDPVQPRANGGHLRVAVVADSDLLRLHLARLLAEFCIDVCASLPLELDPLRRLRPEDADVLLVELDARSNDMEPELYRLLAGWPRPVLFQDSRATETSLSQPDTRAWAQDLCDKLLSMGPQTPQSVA